MTSASALSYTTSVRMIHRAHRHTAHGGPDTTPSLGAGFAESTQVVLAVADGAERCATLDEHTTHLTRA